MKSLEYPDLFYLEAAKGWLILGDAKEANAELDRITRELWTHPDVLEVRFAIYAKTKEWAVCMDIAATMLDLAPDRPTGWINSAFTLHEMKQTQEAWNALCMVRDRFPELPTIPYNLACYACQLGRLEDSRELLKKALSLGGKAYKRMALEDVDLQPLWEDIRQL